VPRSSPFVIELTSVEKAQLETAARQYTSPYRDVIRAKIILFAAEGLSNDVIAARLDTPRQIVSKWRKRFFEDRLMGLEEQARSGRPVRFSPQRGHRG
jgi:transposase